MNETKPRLLATSGTLAGITDMINRFYATNAYSVDPTTLVLRHPTHVPPTSVRVIKKGKRYRFEAIRVGGLPVVQP